LGSTTTFTLNATDGTNNRASNTTVTVAAAQPCTITVNSTYNESVGAPPGGYNYQLSGPSTINGSGAAVYPEPAGYNWTLTYTGGSTATFDSTTPSQSQTCANPGGSITFTLNFVTTPPPTSVEPPTNPANFNTSMDSGVACGAVKLTWDDSSTPGAYYSIYRST
jgi:hypothetical protein